MECLPASKAVVEPAHRHRPLIWDQHGCLPLREEIGLEHFQPYLDAGVSFVSVNVGHEGLGWQTTIRLIAAYRALADASGNRLVVARSMADVLAANASSQLAFAFDFEGIEALDGRLSMLGLYYELGVRTVLLTYNRGNRAASGCHDEHDRGLTAFGSKVVREMNRLGMTVDLSHCSKRTTIEVCRKAEAPVVFSHSGARRLVDHPRNIDDDQIRACAATGGVIGVPGVNLFLGEPSPSATSLVDHIEYIAGLVGPEHVGLGLDYVVDRNEMRVFMIAHPELYPADGDYGGLEFLAPATIAEIDEALVKRGFDQADVAGVLGLNFLRLSAATWR